MVKGANIDLPEILRDEERVVVVDVETTGFSPTKNRVIEVGLMWIERGVVISELAALCNPGCELPDEIIDLTGITQDEVDGADPFEAICDFVIDTMAEPSVVVAYNKKFDFRFLKEEVSRCGKQLNIGPAIDPLLWVRQEDKGQKCGLSVVAERRGVVIEGAHRALTDCYTTVGVMNTVKFPVSLRQALQMQGNFSGGGATRGKGRRY